MALPARGGVGSDTTPRYLSLRRGLMWFLLFFFFDPTQHVKSVFPTKDQTRVSCFGRAVLTTGPQGVLGLNGFNFFISSPYKIVLHSGDTQASVGKWTNKEQSFPSVALFSGGREDEL